MYLWSSSQYDDRSYLLIYTASSQRRFEMTEKVEKKVSEKKEVPTCKTCGKNPRWLVTKRATGKKYYWTYCRECETNRQRTNRARRKARGTSIEELQLNKAPTAALKKNGIETVGDVLKIEGDLSKLDGVGKKSAEQIDQYLAHLGMTRK
jgi:DNA-directed RNA polymerase alpha subunit